MPSTGGPGSEETLEWVLTNPERRPPPEEPGNASASLVSVPLTDPAMPPPRADLMGTGARSPGGQRASRPIPRLGTTPHLSDQRSASRAGPEVTAGPAPRCMGHGPRPQSCDLVLLPHRSRCCPHRHPFRVSLSHPPQCRGTCPCVLPRLQVLLKSPEQRGQTPTSSSSFGDRVASSSQCPRWRQVGAPGEARTMTCGPRLL